MDVNVKVERQDPTTFLPEEAMTYEIKSKKKKKKKKKQQEDPFRDVTDKSVVTEVIVSPDLPMEHEVTIKAEKIEVQLDFNSFPNTDADFEDFDYKEPEVKLEEGSEPIVKVDPNKDAMLITIEGIVNEKKGIKTEPSESSGTVTETAPYFEEPNQTAKSLAAVTCKICHLIFKSKKTLATHQRSRHPEFMGKHKHVCDDCGMSYISKQSLIQHRKRKHNPNAEENDDEERSCEECGLVFKGHPRLRLHMRRKHNAFVEAFKHVCKDCGLSYEHYRSLFIHRKRKHSKMAKEVVTPWLQCPFCPRMFNKRETYARHLQRNHHSKENDKSISEEYLEGFKNEAGELYCKECSQVFSNITYLKLHLRRKHNILQDEFRLKCSICKLSYKNVESLKMHVKRKHDKSFFCTICKNQFESKEAYVNHSHKSAEIKECNMCGQIFGSKGAFQRHMRSKHRKDSPIIAYCSICSQGFHDKRQVKPHILKMHYNIRYSCGICRKSFISRESYKRHIESKHPGRALIEKQKCDQCKETFENERELCKHIDSVHAGFNLSNEIKLEVDMKEVQCTKCSEVFASFNELKEHHKEKHYNPVQCICQACGESVVEDELDKHMKKHHKKELQCQYCDFKTTVRVSMTQHVIRHKNVTTIPCDVQGCRYKTYFTHAMEKHKKNHEQQVLLQCCQCPFRTMNKYILKYHEESHITGQKRFQCDQCEYATNLAANLVMHKYKHSSEKRFKCEVCPFASKHNTSLRFHIKKKHCDLPS